MGYVGTGQEHSSGCRSFDLTCPIYNIDTKKPLEFVVRCLFDNSVRWKSYSIPRQGALVHIVGNLAGKFHTNVNNSTTRPAILITAYKALGSIATTELAMSPISATPPSTGGVSKLALAPPGYTKPATTASWSPKTPSKLQNTQAVATADKITRGKRAADQSEEASSDSECKSPNFA